MADEQKFVPDLDLLSPLIARAKAVLVGKSRSYVTDAIDFARALVAGAEEIEMLRARNAGLLLDSANSKEVRFLQRENERLQAENERLVKEYTEALVRAGGDFVRTRA